MLRISVLSLLLVAALFGSFSVKPKPVAAANNVSVYGAWHCGSDFCSWASVRNMTDFDTRNHWIINRGDGSPTVNLGVLRFTDGGPSPYFFFMGLGAQHDCLRSPQPWDIESWRGLPIRKPRSAGFRGWGAIATIDYP